MTQTFTLAVVCLTTAVAVIATVGVPVCPAGGG